MSVYVVDYLPGADMNLATLRKLVWGYVFVVPVLIVLTAIQFVSVQGVVEAYRREGNSFDIIRHAEGLSAALAESDASIRGFIKTRKNEDLAVYEAGPGRTREVLAQLGQLTQGDAPQQARISRLEAAVATRFELYRKLLETQPMTRPGPAASKTPPPPNEAEVQGEAKSAEIAKVLGDLRSHEFARLPALAANSQNRLGRANRLAPIAGVLAIWMVLLAALLLYRDTARRTYAGVERRIQTRIVESLPLGVCVVDEAGLVLYTNSAQDLLFGYEPGGIVGRHITALRKPASTADIEIFDRAMDELRSEGSWRGDFVAQRKNTTSFNCVAQAVCIDLSGKPHRMFLMASGANPAETTTA
jgi:PAS domain S-box-containing protein